jgi:hypothetical protein
MIQSVLRNWAWLGLVLLYGLTCGCAATGGNELARVAKDWCETIRASQVLPVYPLTEDLQPGDLILAGTPLTEQEGEYRKNGFLPIDNLLGRIPLRGYSDFYGNAFEVTKDAMPPHQWQFPPLGARGWPNAPRAAFPTYGFHVRRGQSLRLGIPIHAVPVGLNLLGASDATGSVELADAYTYGTSVEILDAAVADWAAKQTSILSRLAPPADAKLGDRGARVFYVRAVERVYLVGRVNVSLTSDAAMGGSLRTDTSGPSQLDLTQQDAKANLEKVNTALSEGSLAPGGRVSVTNASSRSVSLQETFARPLVLGYIGFDYPILPGGKLGVPVSSLQNVQGTASAGFVSFGPDDNSKRIQAYLGSTEGAERTKRLTVVKQWLASHNITAGVTNFIEAGEYADARRALVQELQIP